MCKSRNRLAVEYLMGERGLGKSPQSLVGIFTDMGAGSDFPAAFENRVGISLTDYEEDYSELMQDDLPEGETVPLQRVSLAWLVLVAGTLIRGGLAGLLALTRRHSWPAASGL